MKYRELGLGQYKIRILACTTRYQIPATARQLCLSFNMLCHHADFKDQLTKIHRIVQKHLLPLPCCNFSRPNNIS